MKYLNKFIIIFIFVVPFLLPNTIQAQNLVHTNTADEKSFAFIYGFKFVNNPVSY